MTIKYTKEQLNKFDKDLLIELFLGMQGQKEGKCKIIRRIVLPQKISHNNQ